MNEEFSYTTQYTLNKLLFSETYDESVTVDDSYRKYSKSVVMAVVALVLLTAVDIDPYIGWFVLAWAGIEAMSVRFHKAWWLARQMISKAANNELTLTIDEDGVHSKSLYVNSQLLWHDVTELEATEQGWLIHLAKGKTYISNACLSEQAQAFLTKKSKQLAEKESE